MRERAGAGTVCLSGRLQALADMVTPGKTVADVGCDHGFLSIYLVQQKISPKVYAMDVRKGPLSRAEEHVVARHLEGYIETRLSDGLEKLEEFEAQTLVCAGMGGRLMQRILTQGERVARSFEEMILQPQSEIPEFRNFLRDHGYGITRENIVLEEGKYYFMMRACPGTGAVLEGLTVSRRLADKYGGSLLGERHPLLREYLLREYDNCNKIAAQIGMQENAGERAVERQRQIYEEIADLREALNYFEEV